MDTHTLLHLIQSPDSLSSSQLAALKEEAKLYPYFQALHLLIAKADGNSEAIKRAAVYTANRSVLMRIIKSQFNPDVNLPNIDNLDIQDEDINAFERLDHAEDDLPLGDIERDEDFRSQLEALAEGTDEVVLEKDEDFDDRFQEGIQEVEEEVLAEDTDTHQEPTEDEATSEEEAVEEEDTDTQEEEHSGIDADLMASIEAARRSRERYMNDDYATASEPAEEPEPPQEEEYIHSPSPYITDEEDEEVNDPDLMASLAALRQAKEEAMRSKEEAEARMDAMKAKTEQEAEKAKDELEAKAKEEAAAEKIEETFSDKELPEEFPIPETDYPHPEYEDPFTDGTDEFKEIDENKAANAASEEKIFGVDTSLFELDDWLEEPKAQKRVQHEGSAPSHHEVSEQEELDEMTLEERIKAQNSIINSFIEKVPNIKPNKDQLDSPEQSEDLAKKSMEEAPTFVSENLASIMVRQGKYEQAIKIYRQLMLKYPDKKAYFADLIEHLENKQK